MLSLGGIKPDEFPALSDTRFLLGFGPFFIRPAIGPDPDTLRIAVALLSGRTINALQQNATRALELYRSQVLDVEKSPDGIPKQFLLGQNFPNPFNPATTFPFGLGHSSFVTLKVFDLLGREVTTLLNEEKQAGTHSVQFDASHLASGVYYYRMQAGDFADVKKFVVLK